MDDFAAVERVIDRLQTAYDAASDCTLDPDDAAHLLGYIGELQARAIREAALTITRTMKERFGAV